MGNDVVGFAEGDKLGLDVTGEELGLLVVGFAEGDTLGLAVVGRAVGDELGLGVGETVPAIW